MKRAQAFETFPPSSGSIWSICIYRAITEKKMIANGGNWVEEEVIKEMKPDMALFMMGTTDQLTRALKDASSAGIASFYLPADTVLHIRYVRRKTTSSTKSVVGIAPLKEYWGDGP